MTERLHFHFSLSCIGEGNGNPLQCSCLENPRDRGAWWATVYGVTQSWTRLKRLSSRSSSIVLSHSLYSIGLSVQKRGPHPKDNYNSTTICTVYQGGACLGVVLLGYSGKVPRTCHSSTSCSYVSAGSLAPNLECKEILSCPENPRQILLSGPSQKGCGCLAPAGA